MRQVNPSLTKPEQAAQERPKLLVLVRGQGQTVRDLRDVTTRDSKFQLAKIRLLLKEHVNRRQAFVDNTHVGEGHRMPLRIAELRLDLLAEVV